MPSIWRGSGKKLCSGDWVAPRAPGREVESVQFVPISAHYARSRHGVLLNIYNSPQYAQARTHLGVLLMQEEHLQRLLALFAEFVEERRLEHRSCPPKLKQRGLQLTDASSHKRTLL